MELHGFRRISLNHHLSGYNTTQALKVLPRIVPTPAQAKIRFMVIRPCCSDVFSYL